MKGVLTKLPQLIALVLVVYLISWNYRQKHPSVDKEEEQMEIPDSIVGKYFPGYQKLIKENEVVYRMKGKKGMLIMSTFLAKDVQGFAGNVPVIIAVSEDRKIMGLDLLDHQESPGFIKRIRRTGFFESWNGKTLQEAFVLKVDGVSGASMTTDAVQENVRRALNYVLQGEKQATRTSWENLLKNVLGFTVLGLAFLSMLRGGKLKKYRELLLISSILILGVWCGYFISFALLYGWLLNGIPWTGRLLLVVLVLFALGIPLFLGKGFYCPYVCPFGALQELTGKIRKKKWQIKGKLKILLKYTRIVYFAVLLGLLLWGINVDLTSLEPFSIFMYQVATPWMVALAGVFLLLSVFIHRPWCNYCCPTGQLIEFFRQNKSAVSPKKRIYEWLVVLCFMIIVLYLVW